MKGKTGSKPGFFRSMAYKFITCLYLVCKANKYNLPLNNFFIGLLFSFCYYCSYNNINSTII